MRNSKWPDFLFTITVRFVCGVILGGLACFFFSWRGILGSFSHDNSHAPFFWLGLWGFVGGIVAVLTIPRWQTPWYKRDTEALDLWGDGVAGANVVKKSVTIRTVGEDGEEHEYSSMEEVPPELRGEIEALEKEVAQEKGTELSINETTRTGQAMTSKIIQRKNVSVYKIIDESGVERTYHSLEEMPPEVRAAIVEAENRPEDERGQA